VTVYASYSLSPWERVRVRVYATSTLNILWRGVAAR